MIFENSPQEKKIINHWNKKVIPLTNKIKRNIRNPAFFKSSLTTDISNYFQLVSNVFDTLAERVKNYEDKYFVINFLEQLKSETIKDFDAIKKLCAKYCQDTIPTIDDCQFKLSTRASDHSLRPT